MATKYLEQLSSIMTQIPLQLPDNTSFEYKHFFSGAALYVNSRICVTLTPVGFALKLPEEARACLLEQQRAEPLRYFARGPIKKDYVVFPDALLDDMDELQKWVQLSVDYALSLPVKTG
jgi:TfoX/Sxy family transcriptional regulator of competence genes